MKAIVMHGPGLADELFYEDVPKPVPGEGRVLVRIHAASVNQIDWKRVSGMAGGALVPEFPWVPGMDFAGTVEAVGEGVERFVAGDMVFGCSDGGTYAEYVEADPAQLVVKPMELSYVDAAAAAYVAQAAWQALYRHGRLEKGQRVLIHGASGAVGAFAVQFARATGAEVYAVAAGRDRDFVLSRGADVFVDYRTTDFAEVVPDMDLVIDPVGGDTLERSYGVVKPGGRLVTLTGEVDATAARERGIEAVAMRVEPDADDLAAIATLIGEHCAAADIAAVFWLRDACKAWNYVLDPDPDRRVHGKVILQVV
jgi:NADPH:quinone reductase-like Zn-dependent oxidoreductase